MIGEFDAPGAIAKMIAPRASRRVAVGWERPSAARSSIQRALFAAFRFACCRGRQNAEKESAPQHASIAMQPPRPSTKLSSKVRRIRRLKTTRPEASILATAQEFLQDQSQR